MSYSQEEIDKFRGYRMWTHECQIEKTTIQVGDKEPCNWCGLYEKQSIQLKKKNIKEEFLQEITMPYFKEG